MEFRLLGPLEVVDGGPIRSIGGPKQRTVLVHLLLRANHVVPPDRLIEQLWGSDPPPAARSTLRGYVSHLRSALPPGGLERRSGGYVLHADPSSIDALRFERLLAEGRARVSDDPAAAARAFAQALDLWRGPALDDLADQSSLQPEIARLEELRLAAVEERLGAELNLGRHGQLVPDLEALVAAHPFRERLWAHLMTALYRSGRQADALAAFRQARDLLAEELGIDPSPELRDLHARILRQDPALEAAGEPLRGYRLLEQVGAGSFGSVHRAFQPQIGREVAIKRIHPRFANDPEFIRRFEAEAQLIARLEHAHVVPLYDFWREPAGAYLVMRYLRGGSLRGRLAEGALEPEEAARVLEQVALALSAAHRQGVVHRDVKPANILFDEEGNAYLTDFGIAKDLEVADVTSHATTPRPLAYYVSPEEIRGEPPTPRTDVYGLGIVLYEMLAGRHPFADAAPDQVLRRHLSSPIPPITGARSELPISVDEVIARATAKDPAVRYPEATTFASAFRGALVPAPEVRPSVPAGAVRNPYKGLRPFLEPDAPDFFGRDALVAELVARLSDAGVRSRFVAVVGPSGCGKSSLVRAGLLPALRGGAAAGSEGWFLLDMHPGARPFDELASALARVAVDLPADLVEQLERDDEGLLRAAEILPANTDLVLVIDQFEELFTLVDDEDTRSRFLRGLQRAVGDPTSRLRVIVTLRADFFDRPLSYPEFAPLMKARTVVVTPLAPQELERAVAGPVEGVGLTVEPALVADIVSDVAQQPGALPLLQYALTELFEHRMDATLTMAAYKEIGGVSGALSRRAEDLYGRLNEAGREAARQLFLRLITLADDGTEDTRRRVLRSELTSLEVEREAIEAAIDTFGARRLLSFDHDPVTRGPTVEVAHEALLREWDRLRAWVEAAREDVHMHRTLNVAAREWSDSGRDPSILLQGSRLSRFEAWSTSTGMALSHDERTYLLASLARREAEDVQEQERAAREAALERRSLVRLRALVAVLSVLALVASGLSALAIDQRRRAQRETRFATARELAAAAVANLDVDPERSILLALEAVDVTREADGTVVREAEEALHRALKRSRVVLSVPQSGALAVSPDGARFATTGPDGAATVWATATGERLLTLEPGSGEMTGVAFSPDGRRLATTGSDGTARLWDAATGRQVDVLRGHRSAVWGAAFSPDGNLLATTGEDMTIRIWRVDTSTEEMVLGQPLAEPSELFVPAEPVFSPDGSRVTAPLWDPAKIWDLRTGKVALTLIGHPWSVADMAFSPDGTRVVTASYDGTAKGWSTASGEEIATFSGHTGDVLTIAYSPDGSRVATGGGDAIARVWDATTGAPLLILAGHTGEIRHVAFAPDGEHLLTGSKDGTTRFWDVSVSGGKDWLTVPGPSLRYGGIGFSPDSTTFAVPGDRAGVTIRDIETGDALVELKGHPATIMRVAFSPDGDRLAAAAGSGATDREANRTVPVWDVATGRLIMTLTGHEDEVEVVAFTPDGHRLATSSWDGTVRLWDAATGRQLRSKDAGADAFALRFSTDGRSLLAGIGCDGPVAILDSETLELRGELTGHTDCVQDIALGPDGVAVTASFDGTAKVWDLGSGSEVVTLRGHSGGVLGVAISPDGTVVATSGTDGTARLWDAQTGREVLALPDHDRIAHSVAFSPNGRLVATASADGTVALHLLPIEELRALALERVTRELTEGECRQYLRLPACPAGGR